MTASLQLRRPAAVAALVGLLIVFGWWRLLWQPQTAALSAAHTRFAAASTDLFQSEQRLGHLKHLAKIDPQLVALDQRISAAVPAGDELDSFLLQLNAMAAAAGVTVQTVSPGQLGTPKGSVLSAIPLSISVTGGYFQVETLLDQLRTGPRLVIVDGLSESPASAGATSTLTATITAHLLSGLAG